MMRRSRLFVALIVACWISLTFAEPEAPQINETAIETGNQTAIANQTGIPVLNGTAIQINSTATNITAIETAIPAVNITEHQQPGVSILIVGNSYLSTNEQTVDFINQYYQTINQSTDLSISPLISIASCILPSPLFNQSNEKSIIQSTELKKTIDEFVSQSIKQSNGSTINQHIIVGDTAIPALLDSKATNQSVNQYVQAISQLLETIDQSIKQSTDKLPDQSINQHLILVEPPLPCDLIADRECISSNEEIKESYDEFILLSIEEALSDSIDDSTTYGDLIDRLVDPFVVHAVDQLQNTADESDDKSDNQSVHRSSIRVLPLGQAYKLISEQPDKAQENGFVHAISMDEMIINNDFALASMIFAMSSSASAANQSTTESTGISPKYAPIEFDLGIRTSLQELAVYSINHTISQLTKPQLHLAEIWDGSALVKEMVGKVDRIDEQLAKPTAAETGTANQEEGEPTEEEEEEPTNGSTNIDDSQKTETKETQGDGKSKEGDGQDGEPDDQQPSAGRESLINPPEAKDSVVESSTGVEEVTLVEERTAAEPLNPTINESDLLYPMMYLLAACLVGYLVYRCYQSVNQKLNQSRLRRARGYDVNDMDAEDQMFDMEKQNSLGYAHDDGL